MSGREAHADISSKEHGPPADAEEDGSKCDVLVEGEEDELARDVGLGREATEIIWINPESVPNTSSDPLKFRHAMGSTRSATGFELRSGSEIAVPVVCVVAVDDTAEVEELEVRGEDDGGTAGGGIGMIIRSRFPVDKCHIRMVPSTDPETSRSP